MKNYIKRKNLTHTAVAALCALVAAGGFASCDEDLDPWKIVSLEASCSQEEMLPYDGGTFTVSVDANTDWTVTVPEWMTADKTSGSGPGTVSVTAGENSDYEARTGMVQVTAGTTEPAGGVAGVKTTAFAVSQQSRQGAINFNVIEAKVERVFDDGYVTSESGTYERHHYKVAVTYEISTNLTEAEIAEMMKEPGIYVTLNQKFTFNQIPGDPLKDYVFHDHIYITDISITPGRHTVTGEQVVEYGDTTWGHFVESVNVIPHWTLPTGENFNGTMFTFEVNDSRD